MKTSIGVCACLVLIAGGDSYASGPVNYDQVALLKWSPNRTARIRIGNQSSEMWALAFDGENIWAASFREGVVTKVRASDGSILSTFRGAERPSALVFDGANIWVADSYGSTVTKLRARDGAELGTFSTNPHGDRPEALAFDGENIWVGHNSGRIAKLRASDGAQLGLSTMTCNQERLAFDGANLWAVEKNRWDICRLSVSPGASQTLYPRLDDKSFSYGTTITFDGTNIWVASLVPEQWNAVKDTGFLTKFQAINGARVGIYQVSEFPHQLVFDGANIWVGDWISDREVLSRVRPSDGALLDTITAHWSWSVEGPMTALAFDGTHLWVATAHGWLLKI